jgi:hypothetical protein
MESHQLKQRAQENGLSFRGSYLKISLVSKSLIGTWNL